MDLLDLMKLTFRRWYVTAPIIALTIAAAAGVGMAIRPEYRASVAIVLVPPTVTAPAPVAGATTRPSNPWPRIGEAAMAQAVQIAISAHDARSRVAVAGGNPGYEVKLVPRSSILTIEVATDAPTATLTTVDAVTALVTDEVATRQAQYDSDPGGRITAQVLDPGRNVAPSRSNVLRLQIVVVVIGLLLAATTAVGYDAAARRLAGRARRAGSGTGSGPGSGAGAADSPPAPAPPAPALAAQRSATGAAR